MIFIDSNVLIDIIDADTAWSEWSSRALMLRAGPLAINHVVLAEIAPRFESAALARVFIDRAEITLVNLSEDAAHRAGKAHAAYRAAGGPRDAVLADFLIGGHAATLEATLVTRDRQRFATYFPELRLITPESDND